MDGKNWLKVTIFLCLIAVSSGREFKVKAKNKHHAAIYNHTLATILVEYASAVYVSDLTELFAWTCSRCNDLTKGFQMLELIVDVQRCLQAFVGVAQDLNAIVIAFRGTQERRGKAKPNFHSSQVGGSGNAYEFCNFVMPEVMPHFCTSEGCFLKLKNEKESRSFIKREDNLAVEAHFSKIFRRIT